MLIWPALYKIKYFLPAIPEQCVSWMIAPTLNYNQLFFFVKREKLFCIFMTYSLQHEVCVPRVRYTRQNFGTTTEKLALKCNKSFNCATTNCHKQNPCMASGNIFVTIPYCTIWYLGIPCCMCQSIKYCRISYIISFSLV